MAHFVYLGTRVLNGMKPGIAIQLFEPEGNDAFVHDRDKEIWLKAQKLKRVVGGLYSGIEVKMEGSSKIISNLNNAVFEKLVPMTESDEFTIVAIHESEQFKLYKRKVELQVLKRKSEIKECLAPIKKWYQASIKNGDYQLTNEIKNLILYELQKRD